MTAAAEFPQDRFAKGCAATQECAQSNSEDDAGRSLIESAISGWARGFMRGMGMRRDSWAELVNEEEHGGCLIPMMMLYHEHDEDPEMRPKPISPEKREEVIVHMAAGLLGAYQYFRAQREAYAETTFTHEPRRNAPKLGWNDPCPCGSGKKYKRCCGGAAVN